MNRVVGRLATYNFGSRWTGAPESLRERGIGCVTV
jgi:hypothetical protein